MQLKKHTTHIQIILYKNVNADQWTIIMSASAAADRKSWSIYCETEQWSSIKYCMFKILNGKHTQHKCNDIVGESSCTHEPVYDGEDLPARGEYLRCDCHSLKRHHEKKCRLPSKPWKVNTVCSWVSYMIFSLSLTAKLDCCRRLQTMLFTVQTCQISGLRQTLLVAHQGNG